MKLRLGIILLLLVLAVPQPIRGQAGKIRLLSQNAKADWAAVSPNGRWIAFAVRGKPPIDAPSGVYITTQDGKEVATITQGITPGDIIDYPWWSPDSNYILFYVYPLGSGSERLIIATVDGKILSQSKSNDHISAFGPWRFDSKAHFTSVKLDSANPSSPLAVIGLDGKEIIRSPEIPMLCIWPVMSPDGRTLAVIKDQGIVLLDSVTFNMVTKFLGNETINCVGWSPDGKMLLVEVSKPNLTFGQIIVLDITGKQLGSFDDKTLFDVLWSPDSTMLAAINYPEKNSTASVTFYSIDGKVLGSAAMSGAQDPLMDLGFSRWAPDNTYTILTPQGELVAIHADGSIAHDFGLKSNSYGNDIAQPILIWSPNGKMLAMAPNQTDSCCANEIWIYTADGKLLRKLERQVSEEKGRFFWSADNTSLILLEGDNGVWLVTV